MTLVAVGTCTIQSTQAGNTNYAAATPSNRSSRQRQKARPLPSGRFSNWWTLGTAPFTLSATVSSGLAVSFASTTPAVCTVSGATVTLVAVGTCTIRATQAGNANYAAATPVNRSFQVTPESQTITFGALSNQTLGTAPFTVSATASSGLAVSFASTTSTVCTVSGATVTLVAVGTCTIQATQAGNANYAAATPVNQSFQVTPESQTITFKKRLSRTRPWGPRRSANSATVGEIGPCRELRFDYLDRLEMVSGATMTLVAAGTCTIQATQAGNANYAAATPVNQSFQVTPGSGGTFTLIQSANETCGSGSTCAITLTTPIVAGHLVAWQCTIAGAGNLQNIVSVSNGGTLQIPPAGAGIPTQQWI